MFGLSSDELHPKNEMKSREMKYNFFIVFGFRNLTLKVVNSLMDWAKSFILELKFQTAKLAQIEVETPEFEKLFFAGQKRATLEAPFLYLQKKLFE